MHIFADSETLSRDAYLDGYSRVAELVSCRKELISDRIYDNNLEGEKRSQITSNALYVVVAQIQFFNVLSIFFDDFDGYFRQFFMNEV